MKKTICVMLAAILALAVVLTGCTSIPVKTNDTADTTAAAVETTEAAAETGEEIYVETIEDTTEAAGPLTEGSVVISDLISVELKDGWYSEEGLDTTWNSLKVENESIDAFLANVEFTVGNIYSGNGAEYWADAINKNYGGNGTVTTEEINGVTYYHLSGVVDDDTQNIFFTDLDDSHYLEVAIMFMPVDQGMPAFDLLTFLN